ncbi:uncharacterized protein LOC124355282 isoform X5 [Homalodisca vitripennis]|uniref:uncharacterized protein LOC124355282 isoform X5 n=1 Tax=Homalodisca vitripennis TaxID=197043 RepID=UPI001EEA3590|nr:uncharacterized protein LOC124355282 isoform X5 [Homalodisca vitripennis]
MAEIKELIPMNGQHQYTCQFEISIYEVELDNNLINYLKQIEQSPEVFVEWSFLGMEQRTIPMPANKAFFQTRVCFFGPFSEKMADYVKKVADTLEVHIGHVILKNSDVTSDVEGCHLYVEYSLLGHCGPELETDSVPKAEVMRFNHSRRLKVMEKNANHLKPMLDPQHPQNLRFFLLSEPCNLSEETDVKVIGFADLNLMDELVKKKRDVISEPLPLYNNDGRLLGSLSVTVIGNSTLQNYTDKQYQA